MFSWTLMCCGESYSLSTYYSLRDGWCIFFHAAVFVGFVLYLSWAVDSLWHFSHLGLRVSPRLWVSSGPQSGCPMSPCILPLSWSFCSIFLKLLSPVCWIFLLCLLCLGVSFIFFISIYAIARATSLELSYALQHNEWVFNFGRCIFITRESVWLLFKVRLNWYFLLTAHSLWTRIHLLLF